MWEEGVVTDEDGTEMGMTDEKRSRERLRGERTIYARDGGRLAFTEGWCEYRVDSLDEFDKWMKQNHRLTGFLFRGVGRASYELVPSIARRFEPNVLGGEGYEEWCGKGLDRFRLSLRGRAKFEPELAGNELEIWALGRHYGFYTPLLDWTGSYGVALYFAYEGKREIVLDSSAMGDAELRTRFEAELGRRDEDRAVYCLNGKLLRELQWVLAGKRCREFYGETLRKLAKARQGNADEAFVECVLKGNSERAVGRYVYGVTDGRRGPHSAEFTSVMRAIVKSVKERMPHVFSPLSGTNERLVNQAGTFTVLLSTYEAMDEVMKRVMRDELTEYGRAPVLLKVAMPDAEREEVLRYLYEMNVHRRSLFPDIEGAAEYENWKIETREWERDEE